MELDHIGVAVKNLSTTVTLYETLGLPVAHREHVQKDQVNVAFVPFDGGRFELLEPSSERSPVAKFLDRRGEGIHHVALRVEDIAAELERLKKCGTRLIDEVPRPGADGSLVAFIHPSATAGVLVELVQRESEDNDHG